MRKRYGKRYPARPIATAPPKPRPQRQAQQWEKRPLGERTREDLEVMITDLETLVADRDREIQDLNEQLEENDRVIKQLQDDNAWLQIEVKQQQSIICPPIAAEEARESHEIPSRRLCQRH